MNQKQWLNPGTEGEVPTVSETMGMYTNHLKKMQGIFQIGDESSQIYHHPKWVVVDL
jgi:hypothetical protein